MMILMMAMVTNGARAQRLYRGRRMRIKQAAAKRHKAFEAKRESLLELDAEPEDGSTWVLTR